MSNSFRIRTEPGVDKSLNVLIDQEFEYLEILSLKLLQSQIYTRQCSDYGVIVGRVSVNNGFGIPNAKVSVFIPLDANDELNPVTSDLYPYKSLTDLNEDGYRYNLLPYTKSHSGHNPTGTFFNRGDVLTDPTLIQVYDKYYKYSTVTNSSGDYMIFGVPTGSQTIVVDIDLSDIGEFSLSPQDLIRMGIATPTQVAGVNFKSSTNLNSLPQIINFNRTIEVEPLWGQPEICNLGITRTDFDLSKESGIDIRPTAIFMGSIISSNDDEALPRNCKPRLKSGGMCSLVTGPGEILAIRQTIFLDAQGKPILETVDLEEGGQVIDNNGTWLVDVPMNLDYLITNEFGEQVISNDPEKGIPTKGKYRFKVKWNQSPSISEPVRRAYFLVPNIKEHGWTVSGSDPNEPPYTGFNDLKKSYAFSLDWNDYVDFQSAIDCTDTFYLMQYNKVYTVSQLVDQYRKGWLNNQFIGIKNILDDACDSENNKFPTNDGVFRFDLIYFLFWIMLYLFRPVFLSLIPVIHILWFVLKILAIILTVIIYAIMTIVIIICNILRAIIGALANLPRWLGGRFFQRLKDQLNCPTFADVNKIVRDINEFPDKLTNIKIPNLSYPECEFCNCGDNGNLPKDEPGVEQLQVDTSDVTTVEGPGLSLLTPFQIFTQYNINKTFSGSSGNPNVYTTDSVYQTLFAGNALGYAEEASLTPSTRVPGLFISTNNDEAPNAGTDPNAPEFGYFTSSLNIPERLNLFNTKAKYFNESTTNPGGGVNRIKVTFQPDLNPGKFHYDNVIAIVCTASATSLTPGTILTFQDFAQSQDLNVINTGTTLNDYGTNTITGTPINVGTTSSPAQITVNYANPDGSGNMATPVTYQIVADADDARYAKFPMDIEYFQVITGITYSSYTQMCNSSIASLPNDWNNENSFNTRFLSNDMRFYRVTQPQETEYVSGFPCGKNLSWSTSVRDFSPISYYRTYQKQKVIFLVRGVDPNTTRTSVRYDLSRLFGYNFGNSSTIVSGTNYKLNHPIQGTINCSNHDTVSNLTANYYYESFHFKPSLVQNDPPPYPPSGPELKFGFSSFTTNLHTYYSQLDTTNGSFSPGGGALSLNSVTLPSSPVSRVVNQYTNDAPPPFSYAIGTQGWNGFIVEWDILYTRNIRCVLSIFSDFSRRAGTYNVSPNDNRGYYPGEVVEGGSMFYQRLDINQTTGDNPLSLVPVYYAPKYPSTLSLTITLNNSTSTNETKIVMRSDRLPTSTLVQDNMNNSFPLHTNTNFSIFIVTDDGAAINQSVGGTGSNSIYSGSTLAFAPEADNPTVVNEVLESFNCGKMAPLGCYYNENTNIKIYPQDDSCWNLGGNRKVFDGGCYILITQPIISLLNGTDFAVVREWTTRVQTMFGACRNVFSHLFTNNWINGTLYSFSFSNDVIYDSSNRPFSRICGDNIFFDQSTNNFFYRSSPWNSTTSEFIGADRPNPGGIIGDVFGGYGGNFVNLKYPTTVMDLGPRSLYLQELVMSDDFDGYVVNRLNSSTYGDVSELLNLFIITRLANESWLANLTGLGIITYFSRTKMMVDGDYAQMISINSELSVAPFQSINYPDNPPGQQNPIYYSVGSMDDVVFGVFFSSDTQTRDFISPKRTIIDPQGPINSLCWSNNFSVFTQVVPFYQWDIKGSDTQSIFGSQNNEWTSTPIDGDAFFSYPYQLLDRTNASSRYMRTAGSFESQYFKGYIYSVKPNGELDPNFSSINPNSLSDGRKFNVGAPFYFYFGLKKGSSAFDRFTTKWLDTTTTL